MVSKLTLVVAAISLGVAAAFSIGVAMAAWPSSGRYCIQPPPPCVNENVLDFTQNCTLVLQPFS